MPGSSDSRAAPAVDCIRALALGLQMLVPYVSRGETWALSTHHQYVLVDKVTNLPASVADDLRAIGWGTWSEVDPDGKGQTWGFPTC